LDKTFDLDLLIFRIHAVREHCFKLIFRDFGMVRLVSTDAQCEKIAPHCLGKPGASGRSGSDNRRLTVFKRFDDWSKAGILERIFHVLSDDPDMEYAMIDTTIVPVRRHGHRTQGGLKIRRSANPKAAGRRKSSP
jgi:transposase